MTRARVSILAAALLLASCNSERRDVREMPPAGSADNLVLLSDLRAGDTTAPDTTSSPYGSNAYALNQGLTLYHRMNCVGCHFHGGGGIGPPLMDSEWIYGGDPAQIFKTIVEGRPNGMPSFRGKLGNQQVWQLVAYVRSLSGLQGSSASSAREENMFLSPNLATRTEEKQGRSAKTRRP